MTDDSNSPFLSAHHQSFLHTEQIGDRSAVKYEGQPPPQSSRIVAIVSPGRALLTPSLLAPSAQSALTASGE